MSVKKHGKTSKNARRKLLKAVMVGGGAATVGKVLPEQWQRPVVGSVMLPGHAQSTVACTPEEAGGPIQGTLTISDNSVYGTAPPVSGTHLYGSFSVSGDMTIPCYLGGGTGSGSINLSFNGSVGGSFTGTEGLYCDGTLFGSCTFSGSAYLYTLTTNTVVLSGTAECGICTDVFPFATMTSTMDTIGP